MQYSIVNLSAVKANDWRLDGEYWLPEYLEFERIANQKGYPRLKDLKIEKFASGENLLQTENGISFVRTQNIRDVILTDEGLSFTNANKFDKLQEGDILFTRVGAGIGDSSVITKNYINSAYSDNTLCIRIRDNRINNYFLGLYFATQKSRNYIARFFNGTAQPIVSKTTLSELPIPLLSITFQTQIANLVQRAFELQQSSQRLYKEAETLLLEELGLLNWKPKHQLWCIKNYSETVQANRMDAEYFKPMYEEIEKIILNYKNGYSYIKNEFNHIKDSIEIETTEEYDYVEIGSVSVSNGKIEPLRLLGSDLPDNAKRKLKQGQIIISKVRTYRGAVAIVDKDDYVGSGAFTVLEGKTNSKINKETLYIFLKSKPFLSWSLKPNTGTSYPVIIDEDILNFPLPLIDKIIQQQISQKVMQSKENDKTSKSLLETAKKAVEMAIEENEEVAMKFIDKRI